MRTEEKQQQVQGQQSQRRAQEQQAQEQQYRRMTQTPVPRLILTLAVPTTISMLVSTIYNTVDTYFISQLGTSASGAVGIVFSLMAVFQAFGFMCGHGAGSHVSRLLGERRPQQAHRYLSTSFFLSLLLGGIAAALGILLMTPLCRFLGSTETILPYAREYCLWILLSGPFLSASCVLNNVLRYEGRAFYAMIGLTAGGILNMIGDPILMFGFHLGVTGAGISTALSQVISFLILLYMFLSGKTVSRIHLRRVTPSLVPSIIAVGLPSFVRQSLNSISTILLNQQAAPYGDAAIAAMSIVGRLSFMIGSVAIGLGQGLQPVAAFNYGAKKHHKVREAFFFTAAAGTVVLGVLAVLGFVFAGPVIGWFRDDAQVIAIGTAALRWACVSALVQPTSVTTNMLFQSVGKARQATVLAALRSGLCFIPLILLLPRFFGVAGIETAQPLADLMTVAVSVPVVIPFLRELAAAGD